MNIHNDELHPAGDVLPIIPCVITHLDSTKSDESNPGWIIFPGEWLNSVTDTKTTDAQQDMDANLPFTTQPPSNATH